MTPSSFPRSGASTGPRAAHKAALATLSPRESRIVALRVGLIDGNEWTLEEIGIEFGVTRERIRQIEAKAKGKLAGVFTERGLNPRMSRQTAGKSA